MCSEHLISCKPIYAKKERNKNRKFFIQSSFISPLHIGESAVALKYTTLREGVNFELLALALLLHIQQTSPIFAGLAVIARPLNFSSPSFSPFPSFVRSQIRLACMFLQHGQLSKSKTPKRKVDQVADAGNGDNRLLRRHHRPDEERARAACLVLNYPR